MISVGFGEMLKSVGLAYAHLEERTPIAVIGIHFHQLITFKIQVTYNSDGPITLLLARLISK